MNNFVIILLSILLEALPFILLGSLLSGLIEIYLNDSVISRFKSLKPLQAIVAGSLMGVCLPMCECGSVLIVRRLTRKGVPPSAAIAYMLSAPIINPITLLSTYTAYGWFRQMVLWRAGLGAAVAILVGLIVRGALKDAVLKEPRGIELNIIRSHEDSFYTKLGHALSHASEDFISIFSVLLIGATAAALFKAFSPPSVFLFFQSKSWTGIPLFSGLAVLLSVCSESDAFIASAMNTVFALPAQLAFLTVGPMIDLKLLVMYRKVFTGRVFLVLCIVPPIAVMAACFLLGGVMK